LGGSGARQVKRGAIRSGKSLRKDSHKAQRKNPRERGHLAHSPLRPPPKKKKKNQKTHPQKTTRLSKNTRREKNRGGEGNGREKKNAH